MLSGYAEMYAPFVFPIIIGLLLFPIMSEIYKDKKKVDKGFVFNYFKLSHRRKMIRTVTSFPLIIISLVTVYYFSDLGFSAYIILTLVVLFVICLDFIYHYKKWKKEEIDKAIK